MQIFWAGQFPEPGCQHLVEGFIQMVPEIPREVIRNFFLADADDQELDIRPLLPTLRVPTLVLHGEVDRGIPMEAGRYIADYIPGAQFYVFKGGGHQPAFTATAEFAGVVRNFIRTRRAM
jgi:pimeloyl-ACP methyl ester carboxylesterase